MGSDWVGLHMEDMLTGKSFALSRYWLTRGGAISPGSGRPQISKHQNIEEKKGLIYTVDVWEAAICIPGPRNKRMA